MNDLEMNEAAIIESLRKNVDRFGIFLPGEMYGLPTIANPHGDIALMRMPWYDVIPLDRDENSIRETRKIKSVIHSDTLNELHLWLKDKRKLLSHIMIEGRVLTRDQWYSLGEESIYKFMNATGSRRSQQDKLIDILTIILPRNARLSQKQILDQCEMRYGPKQSAESIGEKSTYFPADLLLDVCELQPTQGGNY